MNSNADIGRTISVIISIYMLIKAILNLILGFGMSNIIMLILSLAMAAILILPSSTISKVGFLFKYSNYIVSVILALFVIQNLNNNIQNLPSTLIYFIEGIFDICSICALCIPPAVRKYFLDK